jgi:hypothetical protein
MTPLLTFPVAGLAYYFYDPQKIKRGQHVGLFHETRNLYDPNAIGVYTNGHKVGHVPRDLTRTLHAAHIPGAKFNCTIAQHFPNCSNINQILWVRVEWDEPQTKLSF